MPYTVRFDPTSVSPQSDIIPDVSLSSAGLATPGMLAAIARAGSAANVAYDNTLSRISATNVQAALDAALGAGPDLLFLFVAPGGVDAPGNGAVTSPFATVQYALSTLPIVRPENQKVFIRTTNPVENVDTLQVPPFVGSKFFNLNFVSPVIPILTNEMMVNVYAEPTVLDTLTGPDVIAVQAETNTFLIAPSSVTVAGGITTNRATIAGTGALNGLKGKYILDTTGLQLGVITGNTAGPNIVLSTTLFSGAPGPFQILEESAEIHTTNGAGGGHALSCNGVTASIQFAGFKFTGGGSPQPFAGLYNGSIFLADVINCQLTMCSSDNTNIRANGRGAQATSEACHYTGGYFSDGEDPFGFQSFYDGLTFASNDAISNDVFIGSIFDGCTAVGQGSDITYQANFPAPGTPDGYAPWFISSCMIKNGVGNGFQTCGQVGRMIAVTIDNCAGHAVACLAPGGRFLPISVLGSGNGGAGIFADDGAHVKVIDDSTLVTGAAGDIVCGANAARTWVNFRTIAPIKQELDATVTLSRIWQP